MDNRQLCADVLIVGGGVAGLSCGLFTSQAGLLTMIFDHGHSQMRQVKAVNNFPGLTGSISGSELLSTMKDQVFQAGAVFVSEFVERVEFERDKPAGEGLVTIVTTSGTFCGHQLVIASNLYTHLLEEIGFRLEVNQHVPSGKIRFVEGAKWDGSTSDPRVHIAGLLSNIPSQSVIVAGQGAMVGVRIASDQLGKAYMWHE